MSEHGKTPLLTKDEIGELGYQIALYPSTTLFAAAQSAREMARVLGRDGTSRDALEKLIVFGELNELLGPLGWQDAEEAAL